MHSAQPVDHVDPDAFIEHSWISFIDGALEGRPIATWSDEALGDYCQRYNVGWAIAWSPPVLKRFREWPGAVAVTDLADYGLDLPVDSDAYNSVGGFVFAQLGRLPRRGDTVNVDGFSIRVESVRDNRIEAVRIRVRRPVPGDGRQTRAS